MGSDYKYDVYRFYGQYKESIKQRINRPNALRYMRVFRKYNNSNNIVFRIFYRLKLNRLKEKTFIQIPRNTKIGKGFYIGHNGMVIINEDVIIGNNCNIAAGVVIGQENRGKRKGCPKIGNSVWIGANAIIVGNIRVGNDVLVAPLAYVNCDVPDHSIVIGNPCKIIFKNNATKDYINKTVPSKAVETNDK